MKTMGDMAMKKKVTLIICMLFILCSCGNKLNPEWYPYGAGKDIVYTFGDGKFFLGKTIDGIDLSMFKDDGSNGVILAFVNEYKKKKDKLYIYSDEGYCVIDEKNNIAKVFIIVEKQHFLNLAGEDNAILYLSSYEDFSEEEKNIFKSMKK